jgi:hypothetical protein
MASFDLYWLYVWFMGPGKLNSLVTTLSNCPSLLQGGLLEGEWGSPGRWPGRTIVGGQDFILGAGVRFWLSRDFADGCHTWDPRGQAYDVLVRFFHGRVYTDSNHHDTLAYEWSLVCYSHLVVCFVILMAWIRGWWLWLCYHDDCCITLFMALTALLMFCLRMHVIVYRWKHNIWLN